MRFLPEWSHSQKKIWSQECLVELFLFAFFSTKRSENHAQQNKNNSYTIVQFSINFHLFSVLQFRCDEFWFILFVRAYSCRFSFSKVLSTMRYLLQSVAKDVNKWNDAFPC